MADTGFRYAGTVGASGWTNPNNIGGTPDAVYATASGLWTTIDAPCLRYSGSLLGSAKSAVSMPTSVADVTLGGSTDLWGAELTSSIVNSSTFGFLCSPGAEITVTNYGFSVPSGATINGVEVVFRGYRNTLRIVTRYVDSIGIKIYYTEGGSPAFVLHNLSITGCGI